MPAGKADAVGAVDNLRIVEFRSGPAHRHLAPGLFFLVTPIQTGGTKVEGNRGFG
jgi:hypothetical protein